jgi:hypothetical protein
MVFIGLQVLALILILVKIVIGFDVWEDICKCGLCRKGCVRHNVRRKIERLSSGIELTEIENTNRSEEKEILKSSSSSSSGSDSSEEEIHESVSNLDKEIKKAMHNKPDLES